MGWAARTRRRDTTMTRIYTFTDGATGRVDFRLAYEAFRGRNPEKITKEERVQLAELQTALEGISDAVGDLPDDADLDMRFRKLQQAGGTIEISQRAHDRLATCLDEAPFMAGLSAQVEAFKDRWSAAEKIDGQADASAVERPRKFSARSK